MRFHRRAAFAAAQIKTRIGGMKYYPYVPTAPLSEFVEIVFHLSGYMPELPHERLVPDGSCSLVIELDHQERWIVDNETMQPIQSCRRSWLSGPHEHFLTISALPNSELVAIRFKPGGLYPFVSQSIDSVKNTVVPAISYFGNSIYQLRKSLLDLDNQEVVHSIPGWLESQLNLESKIPESVTKTLDKLIENPAISTISTVVKESELSRKHLNDLFRKYVGLSPKRFQRILRFNRALAKIQNDQKLLWKEISLDCGYSDQAHFIHDFKQFCGMNPTEFLELSTNRANFFPIQIKNQK